MVFYNQRYSVKQSFEIRKSSLKIQRKHLFDSIEYEIPFDHVSNKTTTQTAVNNNVIVVGIFFFVFSLLFQLGPNDELTLIFLAVSILFIITAFVNRKKVITISTMDGGHIELYFKNDNKGEVLQYANEIIAAADNYLLKKYSKVDRALPVEPQIENIQYLLNREIITDEKFESLKNQLLGNENKTAIGFGQG